MVNSTDFSTITINSENYTRSIATDNLLLLETEDTLLLEDTTDGILLEISDINPTNFASQSPNSTGYSKIDIESTNYE